MAGELDDLHTKRLSFCNPAGELVLLITLFMLLAFKFTKYFTKILSEFGTEVGPAIPSSMEDEEVKSKNNFWF